MIVVLLYDGGQRRLGMVKGLKRCRGARSHYVLPGVFVCVFVLAMSGCRASPMDQCKKITADGLGQKCQEGYMRNDAGFRSAEFHVLENDATCYVYIYKNDAQFVAGCELGDRGRWAGLASNRRTRTCVCCSSRDEHAVYSPIFIAQLQKTVSAL
jgi:hypothetical protein